MVGAQSLLDEGANRFPLILGRGAELVAGKFGRALRPGGPVFVAANSGRPANIADSKLNLGGNDWTIECWLWIDARADGEGVIFEFGQGPREQNGLVTRFSVLPRENAFALTGISAVAPLGGITTQRIEYPRPDGPPGGVAFVHGATLALEESRLPREQWCHVALVHHQAKAELRLYIEGRTRAVAQAALEALPRGEAGFVSIGRDGRGSRLLGGALDELRISDDAVYGADFAPPASFAVTRGRDIPSPPSATEPRPNLGQR